MTFDRHRSLRQLKPQRHADPITRRSDEALPLVKEATAGRELLLDACVYIDVLQGRTPRVVDALLQVRIVNHSATALAELTHLYGRLDPARSGTRDVLSRLSDVIDDIPGHRLTAPSVNCLGQAGMLAGLVSRLSGRSPDMRMLNDAILFLQARELGCSVLTRNLADFDLLDRVVPGAQPLFYRAA